MTDINFGVFEQRAGITFKNKSLLKQAFIHRSYINENKNVNLDHNERLEFLGDAVLELITTDFLYKKYTDKAEGDLTTYRSALVNAVTLAGVSEKLGVNDFLLLSKGESKDIGRARQYILANACEAIIGAIYLDQGYDVAKEFVTTNVLSMIEDIVAKGSFVDSKSLFQERAQEDTGITPSYKVLKETGPDHDKYFTIGVFIGRDEVARGDGKSKQEAEQNAAKRGIEAKGWS